MGKVDKKLRMVEPPNISWVLLPADQARGIIGMGLHTGLRKGTDAPEALALWEAISGSDQAWDDALTKIFSMPLASAMGSALNERGRLGF